MQISFFVTFVSDYQIDLTPKLLRKVQFSTSILAALTPQKRMTSAENTLLGNNCS